MGDDATIIETKQSLDLRRGTEKPLDREEQMNFITTATDSWENNVSEPIQAKV